MQNLSENVIRFNGVGCLRQRLILSIITQKPIFINKIKHGTTFGISDSESNLLKLLNSLMNGSTIQINENGTSLYFKPGTLIGGKINHKCNNDRDIGYYLECIFWILPLFKKDLDLTLEGITNGYEDPSIDKLQYCILPILKKFGIDEGINLNIIKRSSAPLGGGIIKFFCPVIKKLNSVKLNDIGFIQRIRGISYSMRVSPTMSSRIIDGAKSVLNNFLSDIFINQDHCKVNNSGISPGFGIVLVAETTTGLCITSEASSIPKSKTCNDNKIFTPEEIGKKAAFDLLDNIHYQCCIDLSQQHILLLYMALSPSHVSKVIVYQPNNYTIEFLKHIELFLGVVFKIDLIRESNLKNNIDVNFKNKEDTLFDLDRFYFSCVGSGIMNYNRTIC